MKKKIFTISALVLLCVAMIGVGFAGWVISNEPEPKKADGNIVTDTVTSEAYTIENLITNEKFNFVGPESASQNVEGAWLTYTGDKHEDLDITFTATIKKGGDAISTEFTPTGVNTASVTLSNGTDKITISLKDSYSGNLLGETVVQSATYDTLSGVLTIVVKASWGSDFDNKNPYEYYSNKEYSEYASDAQTKLQSLQDLNNTAIAELTVAVGAEEVA